MMKELGKTIFKVLAIAVVACFVGSLLLRAIGASNMIIDLIYTLSFRVAMIIIPTLGAFCLRSYLMRRQEKKNKIGMEEYGRVLQYGEEAYRLPIMSFIVFVGLMVSMIVNLDDYLEMLKTWEKPANIIMPWVFGLVTFGYFYYLSRRKVFYSDYCLKIIPLFGKAREIPWSRLRQIEISEDMEECILVAESKTYKFRIDPWEDGWDEFIATVVEITEKYNASRFHSDSPPPTSST